MRKFSLFWQDDKYFEFKEDLGSINYGPVIVQISLDTKMTTIQWLSLSQCVSEIPKTKSDLQI